MAAPIAFMTEIILAKLFGPVLPEILKLEIDITKEMVPNKILVSLQKLHLNLMSIGRFTATYNNALSIIKQQA